MYSDDALCDVIAGNISYFTRLSVMYTYFRCNVTLAVLDSLSSIALIK